jgi:hypothetical protein
MVNYTFGKSKIHKIKHGDPRFTIVDGFSYAQRASIEISQCCPENLKDLIVECIRQGWVKPVAHITERELLFIGLTNE